MVNILMLRKHFKPFKHHYDVKRTLFLDISFHWHKKLVLAVFVNPVLNATSTLKANAAVWLQDFPHLKRKRKNIPVHVY